MNERPGRRGRVVEAPVSNRPCISGRRAALLLLMVAIPACDIPTSSPSWDTRWILDAFKTSFGVEELLPPEVTITPDRSAFLVDVPSAAASSSLQAMCPPCGGSHGQVVPKPRFETTLSGNSTLPGEVRAVDVAGGVLVLGIANGLGFDPIRPGGGATGSLELTVRGGDGRILVQHVLSGTEDALPPGVSTTREIPLVPGQIVDSLRFEARLVSPEGDPVLIDGTETFGIEVSFQNLLIAAVRLAMSTRTVSFDPMNVDTGEVEQDLVDRVEAGAIEVRVDNPFAVELDLSLVIEGPGMPPIERRVVIPSGSSNSRIELSPDEIRSILARPGIVLNAGGEARAPSGEAEVRPDQRVLLNTQMDLTVRVGGGA